MKKILLVLLLVMSASCSNSEEEDAFIAAAKGYYTLDGVTPTEVTVNNDGDIYVGGVKTYDFDEGVTDTRAIYEDEIIKDYYGFSINGTKLSKTKISYLTEKSVVFIDLEVFATKKP